MSTGHIALFGGSFNPPHAGHEAIIRWLASQPVFDAIWVLPVVNHAFSKDLAPYQDREALVEALVADIPRVQVTRREEVYTADLLYNLRRERPGFQFHVVLGADILHECHKWYRWEDVATHAMFIARKGYSLPEGASNVYHVTDKVLSSTVLRDRFACGEKVSEADVPVKVQREIAARGLYRSSNTGIYPVREAQK